MGFKHALYNMDKYGFSQFKFLRKWYGGDWIKLGLSHDGLHVSVWMKGDEQIAQSKFREFEILDKENWSKY